MILQLSAHAENPKSKIINIRGQRSQTLNVGAPETLGLPNLKNLKSLKLRMLKCPGGSLALGVAGMDPYTRTYTLPATLLPTAPSLSSLAWGAVPVFFQGKR